jgi:phytoene dehydrogenase-like protein
MCFIPRTAEGWEPYIPPSFKPYCNAGILCKRKTSMPGWKGSATTTPLRYRYPYFVIPMQHLRARRALLSAPCLIILLTSRIRARGWYEEFKKKVEELFIMTVSSSIYPNLKDKVLFSFSTSPWSIYERVGSSEGSIVGWSFEGKIPVVTSMFNMGSSVKTALPDVYAAGKWVYSPAGGPTAIMTGRIAAKQCK